MPTNRTRNTVITASAAFVILVVGLVFWLRGGGAPPEDKPLNVLLIVMDTTRADHLGCYGHESITTPNIDRLAAEGALFSQCTSPAPITLPATASLLTGTRPFVHGLRVNGNARLHDDHLTLAEVLQQAGYATAAEVGAAVLNSDYGLDQGFETYNDLYASPRGRRRSRAVVERSAEEVCQSALDWLRANGDDPFFLFVHFFDPHEPLNPPARFGIRYEDRYLGEINYVDEQIGRLLDLLDELGVKDNTLVVLTSDHGEGRNEHKELTHGVFLYDSTTRVPLIVRAPGLVRAGQRVDAQVRLIDVAPTVLALAELDPLPNAQGTSLAPLLREPARKLILVAYSESLYPRYADRLFGCSHLRALRADGWKYIHAPKPELYNLRDDPGELANLAQQEPQKLQQMRDQLRGLVESAPPATPAATFNAALNPQRRRALATLDYVSLEAAFAPADESALFDPAGPDPKDYAEEIRLGQNAMTALARGKNDEALELLRALIARGRDGRFFHPWPHVQLGRLLAARGSVPQALEQYELALKIDPDDDETLVLKAAILSLGNRHDEAIAACRRAIEIAPANPRAHLNLGIALARTEKRAEALQALQETVKLDPTLARAFAAMGEVLTALERTGEALQATRQAVQLAPGNPGFRRLHAGLLLSTAKPAEAILHYREALRVEPKDAGTWGAIGEAFRMRREARNALQAFKNAAEFAPDLPHAWASLGLLLIELGKYEEAIGALRTGLQKDAEHFDMTHSLAWLLATHPDDDLRDGAEAVRLAERARELSEGQNAAVLDTLAAALAEAGRFADALRVIEEALQAAAGAGADAERIKTLQSRKTLYQQNKRYHMPPAQPAGG